MTEPLMPYSVTYYASSGSFLYPDVSQRGSWTNNYYRHLLTPGTYMLQVAYFSTGKRLNFKKANAETFHVFEAGQTGWLRSPMIQVAVPDGTYMFLEMISNVSFGENAIEKAALNVYPLERFKP